MLNDDDDYGDDDDDYDDDDDDDDGITIADANHDYEWKSDKVQKLILKSLSSHNKGKVSGHGSGRIFLIRIFLIGKTSIFKCSLPTAMSISRSEFF